MIVRVKVGDRIYDVEITDLSSSPVIAMVDGVRFEVYPTDSGETQTKASSGSLVTTAQSGGLSAEDPQVSKVVAPMPGVITAVSVKPGQQVARGGELCVLEAMKMKNSIRAPRSGLIGLVHVAVGQQVTFRDVLVEYQE